MLHRERQSGSVAHQAARAGRRPEILAELGLRSMPLSAGAQGDGFQRMQCHSIEAEGQGTEFSLRAERNTRPSAWPVPTEAGDSQGR
jgi:hypothetical protein